MGNVILATSLVSPSATPLNDLADTQFFAIKSLINTYASGLGQVIRGWRPMSDVSVILPCVMIQPSTVAPKMYTTAKYKTTVTHKFACWQGDNNSEALNQKGSNIAFILRKLFSQNALNDLQTGSATFSFKHYLPNWNDSEMTNVEITYLGKFWKQLNFNYTVLVTFDLQTSLEEII